MLIWMTTKHYNMAELHRYQDSDWKVHFIGFCIGIWLPSSYQSINQLVFVLLQTLFYCQWI